MRTLIKLSSLAAIAGLMLAVGCGSDDSDSDNDDDSTSTGGSGGTSSGGSGGTSSGGSGGTSSGGSSTSSGGTSSGGSGGTSSGDTSSGGSGGTSSGGTSSGGSGGTSSGGSGGTPPIDEAPYANDDCIDAGGPNSAVTASETGAFVGASDWHEGWTNFSTDSSGTDACAGDLADLPIESDGTFSENDTTLTADDGPYLLDQKVYVASGQTLTIEPGTVFCGGPDGSLIVSRGGMIDAEGTANEPIIFTSLADEGEKERGDWGGVILLGNARSFKGEEVLIEGLNPGASGTYGGTDDDESSGTFAYVRIEFGGTEIAEGNEINGLTLGGVGSGTTIHHVQVNTTLDDCFEWFGGAVDADHLVCHNPGDDMFDSDEGWRGTLDTALGISVGPVSEDPNGFEMDSSLNDEQEPTTNVTATNVTLCGSGQEEGGLTYGMVLRERLEGALSNVVISGFNAGVDTRDDFGGASDPHVTISNSIMFEGITHTVAYDETNTSDDSSPNFDDDGGFDERAWFEDGEGNKLFE